MNGLVLDVLGMSPCRRGSDADWERTNPPNRGDGIGTAGNDLLEHRARLLVARTAAGKRSCVLGTLTWVDVGVTQV